MEKAVIFHGILHVWKVTQEPMRVSSFMDTMKVMGIRSKGPSVVYDSRYGFDCFEVRIQLKPGDRPSITPGDVIDITGNLASFNSKWGAVGAKWVVVLESSYPDRIKVIARSVMPGDPIAHLAITKYNYRGLED